MARKALLIGSQTGALEGVGNDVALMADVLEKWEFTSVRCDAENASRAGILDEYERLIAETRSGDAVLVYYSGHGAYSTASAGQTVQCIVPTDYELSTEDDFRGITSIELSLLLARLTEKTKNATVVLDCCHAGHMSRHRSQKVKALTRAVPYQLIASHLDNLFRRERHLDLWTPTGNPDAVRLVACAPQQSAYEYENDRGIKMGMLTDALTVALTEAKASGLDVSWSAIVDRVRQQVLMIKPSQRPEAEGPARRLVFDVAEADPVATLPVSMIGGRILISGAALFGVQPGDEFEITSGRQKIGEVRVDQVDSMAAWGVSRTALPTIPVGAQATLVRTAARTLPVRVKADPRVPDLARVVGNTPLVRLAAPGENCSVEVDVDGAGLTVRDDIGPLHLPRSADTSGVSQVRKDLQRLAQASALRRLAEGSETALTTPISVEFGQIQDGVTQPLPSSGAVLHVGQPIYVRVRNDGKNLVYVSLLDIGVSSKITLLNASSPSGELLTPGEEYVFGHNLKRELVGVKLGWPDSPDRLQPRPETIVVLVSSEPVDARILEQGGVRGIARSDLGRFFEQLATGGSRDLEPRTESSPRFAVCTIDFDLVPSPAPVAETVTYQVDERPDASTRLWSPRTGETQNVTIRLTDLLVHHNRTFRSADIRLDAVAVGSQACSVHTERFSNVHDGQRIPLDVALYQGPMEDYLDFAVWISPDSVEELVPPVALDGPEAVLNAIRQQAFDEVIGLYRTTFLTHEQFGQNTVRAQDFSLTYVIEKLLSVKEQVEAHTVTSGEGLK